jgi:hypothetical protein
MVEEVSILLFIRYCHCWAAAAAAAAIIVTRHNRNDNYGVGIYYYPSSNIIGIISTVIPPKMDDGYSYAYAFDR